MYLVLLKIPLPNLSIEPSLISSRLERGGGVAPSLATLQAYSNLTFFPHLLDVRIPCGIHGPASHCQSPCGAHSFFIQYLSAASQRRSGDYFDATGMKKQMSLRTSIHGVVLIRASVPTPDV